MRGCGIIGLIHIDDRDVINNYYAQADPKTLQRYLNSLKSENKTANVSNLGEGRFKIDLPGITCTGADVTTLFQIPFMHVFEKLEIKHVNSAYADSIDAMSYSVSHRMNPNLWLIVLTVIDSVSSDIIDEYANFRHERGQYKIISNSTNTDIILMSVYIRYTGE